MLLNHSTYRLSLRTRFIIPQYINIPLAIYTIFNVYSLITTFFTIILYFSYVDTPGWVNCFIHFLIVINSIYLLKYICIYFTLYICIYFFDLILFPQYKIKSYNILNSCMTLLKISYLRFKIIDLLCSCIIFLIHLQQIVLVFLQLLECLSCLV